MSIFVVVIGSFFALLSSVVLAYISIATMIGPWIAPTLVLIASVLIKLWPSAKGIEKRNSELVLVQSIGSVGGILATAVGFTIPTLYFLDKNLFNSWLQSPLYFFAIISGISFSAGGFGIYLARLFGNRFVNKEKLPLPVGQLVYNMITSQSQAKQARNMFLGLFGTGIFCFVPRFKMASINSPKVSYSSGF